MEKEEAVRLLLEEMERCQRAPELNGCEMKAEWQRTMDVCRVAVEAIREQEQRRWIPVTEHPQKKGSYLVTARSWIDGKPVTREAVWNGCDWMGGYRMQEITQRVTHWMPLPEPPKDTEG